MTAADIYHNLEIGVEDGMIHWKFAGGCAAVAALLSVTAGLIGKVGAGPLIFRALLSGIVFGVLATGLELVGRKFLPELFSFGETVDNNTEGGDAGTGSEVDIVVDDEEPLSFFPSDDSEETGPVTEDAVIEVDDADVLEENPLTAESGASEDGGGQETAPAAEPRKASGTASSSNGLPNIDDFFGSFEDFKEGAPGVDSLDSSKARTLEAIDSLGEENDPATMAKAIRSMIQKDQEG